MSESVHMCVCVRVRVRMRMEVFDNCKVMFMHFVKNLKTFCCSS